MLPILFEVLSAVPTLVADGENVFEEMATGEGGVGKVRNVMQGLATLMGHAFEAVAGVASVPQVQGPPAPAPAPRPAAEVAQPAPVASGPLFDEAGNPMGAPPSA